MINLAYLLDYSFFQLATLPLLYRLLSMLKLLNDEKI